MNESALICWRLAVCLALWASPVGGGSGDDSPLGEGVFRLRSGDRFTGRIEGVRDGGAILAVRHPLVAEVLSIETAALAGFEAAGRPGVQLPTHWQVALANGDRLAGKAWALSAVVLDLETETARRVTIPRAWLRSLTRLGGAAPVLDGPGAPSDWKPFNMYLFKATDDGGLSFTSGRGVICRALPEMPDVFRLDKTIRYIGEPNWRILFYASDIGVTDVGGYVLERVRDTLRLQIQTPARERGGGSPLRTVAVAERNDAGVTVTLQTDVVNQLRTVADGIDAGVASTLEQRTDAVTMMFDRSRQAMRVFLNGELVSAWTGIEPLDTFGQVISLGVDGSMFMRVLRDIRLAPMTALPPDTTGAGGPGYVAGVWLEDGTRLTGNLEALDGGRLRVRTATGDVETAADKVLHIAFAPSPEPAAQRGAGEAGDTVVALRDGGRISLGFTGIEDGMVAGRSPVTGAIRFRLADVRRIDWVGDDLDAEAPRHGRFELSNGDLLSGTFERWDPVKRAMRLRHPRMRGPLTVALADLKDYTVGSMADAEEPGWRVDLGAGDGHIWAVDLQLDETQFTLQTRYAGTLSIPREAVSVVAFTENNPVLLRGLEKEGWRFNDDGPTPSFLVDGSEVLVPHQGYMSRTLPTLPEAFRIDIETQSYARSGARLHPLANRHGIQDLNAFVLDLPGPTLRRQEGDFNRANFIFPERNMGSERQMSLWVGMPDLRRERHTVIVDASQRTVRVYSDRVFRAEWRDVQWLTDAGRFFTVYGGHNLPFKVTDLRIAQWDVLIPEIAMPDAVTDTDILHLRNRDVATGHVLSINSGLVRAATVRLTLNLPVARVAYLQIAGKRELVDSKAMDTQLTLNDGSLLRMPSSGMTMEGTMITGQSPSLGTVQMSLKAVRSIRWERYADQLGDLPTLVEVRGLPPAASTLDLPAVTIPYIEAHAVDVDGAAWAGVPAYRIPENADADLAGCPEIRLVWNRDGLFARVEAPDRNPREAVSAREIASGSSVEIYVAAQRGSRRMVRSMISPGVDGMQAALRTVLLDYRSVRLTRLTIETASRRTGDGYVLTARLPWRNLNMVVRPGDEIAVQCVVNRPEDEAIMAFSWHPEPDTFGNSNRMRRVILGSKPGGAMSKGLRNREQNPVTEDVANKSNIVVLHAFRICGQRGAHDVGTRNEINL